MDGIDLRRGADFSLRLHHILGSRRLKPESTDQDVMKGKDRLGDGSANWQFAPLDQRSLCQAQALSSVAAASINVRWRKRRKLAVSATFSDRSLPANDLHLEGERTKLLEPL